MPIAIQDDKERVCVGILAADPLRSIGLQSILEEGLHVRAVILPDSTRPRQHKLKILIVDQDLGARDGNETPRPALFPMPGVAVVLMVRDHLRPEIGQILASGARAVLPETAEVSEIRACVRAVLRGETWMPASKAAAAPLEGTSIADRLTPKEREVLGWLVQGQSNREIADTMGIDEATVKAHLGRMLRKAEVSNRVELTLRALGESGTKRADPRGKA